MKNDQDPMLKAALLSQQILNQCEGILWARVFVELKMDFFRAYGRGLISSCEHGIDYFDTIVKCCRGEMVWKEKGEYGDNFRKMINERPR